MPIGERDQRLAQMLRKLIREEVEAVLDEREGRQTRSAGFRKGGSGTPATLTGVGPYYLVPYAEYVLKEAGGGPLHASVMAQRIYELGFQHKWPPKYQDQLQRSLNALASPSQHPEKFERVGPRMLKLR